MQDEARTLSAREPRDAIRYPFVLQTALKIPQWNPPKSLIQLLPLHRK